MSVDHRTPEQKVRALLAARGLSQSLFSGTRLLEQQKADRLRFVGSVSPGGPGRQRFRLRRQRHGGQK